jgi:hypothetical protein
VADLQGRDVDPGFPQRRTDVVAQLFTLVSLVTGLADANLVLVDLVQGEDQALDRAEDFLVGWLGECVKAGLEPGQGGVGPAPKGFRPQDTSVRLLRRSVATRKFGLFLDRAAPLVDWASCHGAIIRQSRGESPLVVGVAELVSNQLGNDDR